MPMVLIAFYYYLETCLQTVALFICTQAAHGKEYKIRMLKALSNELHCTITEERGKKNLVVVGL